MAGPSAAVFVVLGVVFRLGLTYTVIGEWISDRVEVSTPLNSWRRVTEGLHLHRMHMSPYDGDVFHEVGSILGIAITDLQTLFSIARWPFPGLFIAGSSITALKVYFGTDCVTGRDASPPPF